MLSVTEQAVSERRTSMIARTADGLIGANTALKEIRTPMKVFKEARARGDTAVMKRAMGYVDKFNDSAWEHKAKADEGLKQEAVEAKEKAQLEREELARRIKENREEAEKKTEEKLSGAENAVQGEETPKDGEAPENPLEESETAEAAQNGEEPAAPVTYTKSGTVKLANTEAAFSVTA